MVGRLIYVLAATRIVRTRGLLQRDVILVVSVVSLVRVESLTGVLVGDRARGVLWWRGLVVLVAAVAKPSAVVVLRLLRPGWPVVGILWVAMHHPPGAVAGLQALTAAAAVIDARPGDEEGDEEDDDDGS